MSAPILLSLVAISFVVAVPMQSQQTQTQGYIQPGGYQQQPLAVNNGLRNFNDYPSNYGTQGQGYGNRNQYQYNPNMMSQPYGMGYRF